VLKVRWEVRVAKVLLVPKEVRDPSVLKVAKVLSALKAVKEP
jgi:hypothetical protein